MSDTKISTSVANPIRTAGQGGVGGILVETIDAFDLYHFNTHQAILATFLLGGLVSFIQNVGENNGWWKPILRTVPPKKVDIVDDLVVQPESGPVEQTDNRPRDVDPDEQVSQDPDVDYGEQEPA